MKHFIQLSLTIIITALSISSCNSSNTNEITVQTIPSSGLNYPINYEYYPKEEFNEIPYPVETKTFLYEIESIKLPIPTPQTNTGVIHGKLLSLDSNKPVEFSKIVLASKVYIDPENHFFISIKENTSPQTISSESGYFIIINIPPGEYLLVLTTPSNTFPVVDDNSEEINLSITGGELIDLGELFTNWPNY